RLILENVRVIGVSQLMRQRRHVVAGADVRHKNSRLFVGGKAGAESPLSFSRAILGFDPTFFDRQLGEIAKVGTKVGERLYNHLAGTIVRNLSPRRPSDRKRR